MNWISLKDLDVANGKGLRVSLFVAGCHNHCKGCFNPESWDFEAGEPLDDDDIEYVIELLRPNYITGFSLLGGDPFASENIPDCMKLLQNIRDTYPEKDIWCWTGYTIEDLMKSPEATAMLSLIDILVDGPFIEEKKNLCLAFRGSENQRIWDIHTMKQLNFDDYRTFDFGKTGLEE